MSRRPMCDACTIATPTSAATASRHAASRLSHAASVLLNKRSPQATNRCLGVVVVFFFLIKTSLSHRLFGASRVCFEGMVASCVVWLGCSFGVVGVLVVLVFVGTVCTHGFFVREHGLLVSYHGAMLLSLTHR